MSEAYRSCSTPRSLLRTRNPCKKEYSDRVMTCRCVWRVRSQQSWTVRLDGMMIDTQFYAVAVIICINQIIQLTSVLIKCNKAFSQPVPFPDLDKTNRQSVKPDFETRKRQCVSLPTLVMILRSCGCSQNRSDLAKTPVLHYHAVYCILLQLVQLLIDHSTTNNFS